MDSRMRLGISGRRVELPVTACLTREMFMAIVVITEVLIVALVAMVVMIVRWVVFMMVMSDLVIVSVIRHSMGMSLQSLATVILLSLMSKMGGG